MEVPPKPETVSRDSGGHVSPEPEITKQTVYQILKCDPARVTFIANDSPQAKSEVWRKFKLICLDGKPIPYVKCNSCIAIFQWNSRSGTTTLSKHKCNIPEPRNSVSLPPEQRQLTNMIPRIIPSSALDTINDTVTTGLALDLRPLAAVEGQGFLKIGQALINFGAKYGPHKIENVVKGRLALRNTHLFKLADKVKKEIANSVALSPAKPCFAFTFDLWTEQKRNRPFISLTCHFVDEKFVLQSKLLGAEELPSDEKKTTANIRVSCQSILKQYFDEKKVLPAVMKESYAVTDGGSNVVGVFQKRLPCICHRINLILENTFSAKNLEDHTEIQNVITNCKSLVRYFKKSTLNSQLKTTLKQTVATRWNSHLTMFESISDSYEDVQRLLMDKKQLDRIMGVKESLINELVSLLKPFKKATDMFSSEKMITIDKIVPQYFVLCKHLQIADPDSLEIRRLKTSLKERLDQYYHASIETIHYAITSLNPKYKSLKMATEDIRASAYATLRDLIAENSFNENDDMHLLKSRITEGEIESVPKRVKLNLSMSDFEDSTDDEDDDVVTVDEVEAYLETRLSKAEREDDTFNPLTFWIKSTQFPKLRKLAFRLLAIPASQTADERTFSITGQTINDRRSRLSGKTVSALTIIHKNLS